MYVFMSNHVVKTAVMVGASESPLRLDDATVPSRSDSPVRGPWRRRLLVGATGLAFVGASGLGVLRYLGRQFEQSYGTVSNPRYSPSTSVPLAPAETLQRELLGDASAKGRIQVAQERGVVFDTLEAELLAIKGLPLAQQSHRAIELCDAHFAARTIRRESSPSSSSASRPGFAPLNIEGRSAPEVARRLIEQVLGESLPTELVMKEGKPLGGSMGGIANPYTRAITVTPPDDLHPHWTPRDRFLEAVGTYAHEVGHFIYPRYEQELFSGQIWRAESAETRRREEAVAHVFRALVAAQLEDPSDRFRVGGDIPSIAARFYSGERDYGFIAGGALADAALTLYGGDYRMAFDALRSDEPLDSALDGIIERNQALHDELEVLEAQVAERESALRSQLEALRAAAPNATPTNGVATGGPP